MKISAATIAIAMCGLLLAEPSYARSDDIAGVFNRSAQLDFKSGERKGTAQHVISRLKAMRQISQEPTGRMDYMDYYAPNGKVTYSGCAVLVVEHEHMTKYAGCCVNPGLALVVAVRGTTQSLQDVAAQLGCSVESPYDATEEMAAVPRLKRIPARQLARIRCQERDARDAMEGAER
jgi:hypothetical protein